MEFFPDRHAERHPDKPAYLMARSGEVVTYRQLRDRSQAAARLMREHGAQHGDCVALMLENHPRFFELAWAAQRAGLRYTTISPRLTAVQDAVARAKEARINPGIGVDGHASLFAVARDVEPEAALALFGFEFELMIGSLGSAPVRDQPHLIIVLDDVVNIFFRMDDATAASADMLHLARGDRRSMAHVVAVRERSRCNVGDDLSVAMGMGRKTRARLRNGPQSGHGALTLGTRCAQWAVAIVGYFLELLRRLRESPRAGECQNGCQHGSETQVARK